MARRKTNTPSVRPYSWNVTLDYDDPTTVSGTSTLNPVLKDKIEVPAKNIESMKAKGKVIGDTYYNSKKTVGSLAQDPALMNLENIGIQVLKNPKLNRSWDVMIRDLKQEPLPIPAIGWRVTMKFQFTPAPEGTPTGYEWFFVVSKSTAYPDIFDCEYVLESQGGLL